MEFANPVTPIRAMRDVQKVLISAPRLPFTLIDEPDRKFSILLNYWLRKRQSRIAPARADILPEEITSILPNILLIDVVGETRRLRYRLVGTEFVEVYGAEVTGLFVDEVDFDGLRQFIIADYQKVARDHVPSWTSWSFAKGDGRWLEYERLVLPLSSDGVTVDMLLVAIVGGGLSVPDRSRDLDVA